jgi:hypothetical protein
MLLHSLVNMMLVFGAMAATIRDVSPSDQSITDCRAQAKSSIDECACFPGCNIVQNTNGLGYKADMSNSTFLNKRQGCANPRAYVTPTNTVMNFGTLQPFDIYTKLFERCGQRGCDPAPISASTTILKGSGRALIGTKATMIAKGWYRDWPDRDGAANLLRESSRTEVNTQWRYPGYSCRPGVDCEQPDAIPQHHQRNYYQVEHWNNCGIQVHMEAEIKISEEGPAQGSCAVIKAAVEAALGPLKGQLNWLFGAIEVSCAVFSPQ